MKLLLVVVFSLTLILLILAASCGLPTNRGIARALEEEFSPVTIILVNDTIHELSNVRLCPMYSGGDCIYVIGNMPPMDATSLGPVELGWYLVEWVREDGVTRSQAIWIVLTEPVYILRDV